MSRVVVSAWTTLDGFVAGLDDSMGWLRADADLMAYEIRLVEEAGALLLGRVTHADFASHWPAVAAGRIDADEGSRRYARRLDQLDKVVASRSGEVAEWPGTRRIAEVTREDIRELRDHADGDVVVYGSLRLVSTLRALDLIDELHLVVNPILLGRGKPLLDPDLPPTPLELRESRPFAAGAVLLRYAVQHPGSTGEP